MHLNRKLCILVALSIVGLITFLVVLSHVILAVRFHDLEAQGVERNMRRVLHAIATDLQALERTAADWAYWDDTYQFMHDQNAAYIESNIGGGVFVNLKQDVLLFIDPAGRIVFGRAYDRETGEERPVPTDLPGYLVPGGLLVERAGDSMSGIVRLEDGPPLLVAARAILTSEQEGPSRGTLVWGHYWDTATTARLSAATELDLTTYYWDSPSLPADLREIEQKLTPASPVYMEPLDGDTIAGYVSIRDIGGEPVLLVQAVMARTIFAPAHDAVIVFNVIMVVTGALFLVGTLILLRRFAVHSHRLDVVFSSSPTALLLLNEDGSITQMNPAARQLFGGSHGNLAPGRLEALLDPASQKAAMRALQGVLQKREPQRVEVVAQDQDRQTFDAEFAFAPIRGIRGRVTGAVCTVRNITAHKQAAAHLRNSLQREMELNALRSRVVAVTSHELRTPLAVMRLSTDLLMRYGERLTSERREAQLCQIQGGIERMVNLIDNVLIYNHLDSGRRTFSLQPLDVAALCQEIIDEYVALNDGHRFELSVFGTRSNVAVDRGLLRYAVTNLISNAVKYSPPGTTVRLRLTYRAGEIVLEVEDEGIGVPPEDQPHIFEPFYRAQNADSVLGTGLGLAIARQAAEMHAGTIKYESNNGAGSTFTVTLPCAHVGETYELHPGH